MKITIDTNTDSKEDIKKAVSLLQTYISGESGTSSEVPKASLEDGSGPVQDQDASLFSLFDDGDEITKNENNKDTEFSPVRDNADSSEESSDKPENPEQIEIIPY